MKNIKLLDCTLRDGGYINNWEFGQETSKNIIENLCSSNIDYVEIGFLTKKIKRNNQNLFNDFDEIKDFLPTDIDFSKLALMIHVNDFEIENFINSKDNLIKNIRIIFKKYQQKEALEFSKKIQDKGYNIFINPTFIFEYSNFELVDLVQKINSISPFCASIVDSIGSFNQKNIEEIFQIFNSNLKEGIALCFHSHNNLQLSFSNVKNFVRLAENSKKEIIIDSTLYGIGRGAGNLSSEIMVQYLNDNFSKNYQISPLLNIIDEKIKPIHKNNPWGFSTPYYLSAIHFCHPNYARDLIEKRFPISKMEIIFKKIPDEKKVIYDERLIEKMIWNLKF